MQAVVVERHGGPEVLNFREVPDPEPAPGEVLVELRAAGINRRDAIVRSGTYDFPLPLIPGSDGAGIRRDTGEEVVILPIVGWGEGDDAPAPGNTTFGGPGDGTYAELVAVPGENLFPKPARLSWEETAALPVAGGTAYRALITRAGLAAGETVLVLGAGSGVSTYGLLLAREAGAHVLVTSSSAAKLEQARELGAEAGFDYTAGDWVEEVREATGGRGVDIVLDSIGSTWNESLRCLRPGGRAVVFGATGGTEAELEVRPFYFGQFSLLGTTGSSPRDFAAFLEAVGRASWRPVLDSVRPLDEVVAAHERLDAGEQFGKLVLRCSSP